MRLTKSNNILTYGGLASIITGILLLGVAAHFHIPVFAQEVDELRDKIENRNSRIEELEKEIEQYESRIRQVQSRQQTLENKIEEIRLSRRRLETDIALTQEQINAVSAEIDQITADITETQNNIEENKNAIREAIRTIDASDSRTLVEKVLAKKTLAEVWSTVDTLRRFQISLQQKVAELQSAKKELGAQRDEQTAKRQELLNLRASLEDKRQIVLQQEREQNQLLEQTENQESNYRSLLAEKRRQKEQFEQELQQFEEQLQIAIDESRLPDKGSAVFRYPFDGEVYITQQFGGTRFAKQNPQAYGRPFHNGTDFGLPVGTPIKAVRGGTVTGTGNTDAIPGCYSYGKWVLVEHTNGLSTLYAHLSLIKTSEGAQVSTGETIAYSGNTGYSTGPHLHLTTYATEGVRIVRLGDVKEQTNCGSARIPVATTDAYLNSMSYLPQI